MDLSLKNCLLSSGLLDFLNFNGSKYSNSSDSKSLITVYEQQLYAWSDEGAVLTVDLSSSSNTETSKCKKLIPTNPPIFDVECIIMNCLGNLLALVGRKGTMIVEIPWEVGKLRTYTVGNNYLFCRSWSVADKLFAYSSRAILLQAAWYPGCKTSTYLMILSSDNFLRLYDTMDPPTPLQTISLGLNARSSYISTEFSISLPSCLGESAISFDFGLPEKTLSKNEDDQELICPIYVLHGNGDVYVVKMHIKKNGARSAKVSGPLSMYPPAEDNYGVDACTLLCLHSSPPILVLAMASGILYHCLVLEENPEINESPQWSTEMNKEKLSLYVHGSIQLRMFVTPEDDVCNQAIRLYRDIFSTNKYHCSMVCGVHTVVIPFVKKMEQNLLKGDNEEALNDLLENDCIVEHLLCTRPLNPLDPVPVIGVASIIRNAGINLICLLASWEIECFTLLSSFTSFLPSLLSLEIPIHNQNENDSSHNEPDSFEDHIKQILCRTTGTPILKSATNAADNISTKHWLDLIQGATQHFIKDYICKFYYAKEEIDKRVKTLSSHKQHQILQLKELTESKDQLQRKTQNLVEKYDDAFCKQQELFQRIDAVLKRLEQRFPCLSNAEQNMKTDLQNIDEKLKTFQGSLDQLKKKLKHYKQEIGKIENKSTRTDAITMQLSNVNLGETQLKHVKELLQQEGSSIKQLIHRASSLKEEILLLS